MTTDIQNQFHQLYSVYQNSAKIPAVRTSLLYNLVDILVKSGFLERIIIAEKMKDSKILVESAKPLLEAMLFICREVDQYYRDNKIIIENSQHPLVDVALSVQEIEKCLKQQLGDGIGLFELQVIEKYYISMTSALSYLMYVHAPSEEAVRKFFLRLGVLNNDNEITLDPISAAELDTLFKKTISFIRRCKIYNTYIEHDIIAFKKCVGEDVLLRKYFFLLSILNRLYSTKLASRHHLDFVKKYAEVNEEGCRTSYKIDSLYYIFLNAKQQIQNVQKAAVWYVAERLMTFHESYALYGEKVIETRFYMGLPIYGLDTVEECQCYLEIVSSCIKNGTRDDIKVALTDSNIIENKINKSVKTITVSRGTAQARHFLFLLHILLY